MIRTPAIVMGFFVPLDFRPLLPLTLPRQISCEIIVDDSLLTS